MILPARSARLDRTAFLLLAVILIGAAPAAAQCPASAYAFATGGLQTVESEQFHAESSPEWVTFDHPTATYALHSGMALPGSVIRAIDRFELAGVPPGTQMTLTARFAYSGFAETPGCGGTGCCGRYRIILRSAADTAVVNGVGHTFGGRADFSGVLELPLLFVAGQPRDVEVYIEASRCGGGSHETEVAGTVSFEGDDPDALITSCKSFGPVAVPTLSRTWGRVKSMYR